MATYTETIDVNVPLNDAYNQWTQFEDFPQFMEGIESVQQVTDTELLWHAEIAGVDQTWRAEITEQEPDQRIAWTSTTGATNAGVVSFHYIDENTTRVTLQLTYDPEGILENIGAALGIVEARVRGDMHRFKDFIEQRSEPTGAWRGVVEKEV